MTGHNAQHTQHVQHTQSHAQSRSQGRGEQRGHGGRRDLRSLDGIHHRVDGWRDRNGRMDMRFEGYWFNCGYWPEWVFAQDVYVAVGPNGFWYVYAYEQPDVFLQVTIVD